MKDCSSPEDEWFDEKSGRLKLRHMNQPVFFTGVQKRIISILWKARNKWPLTWQEIKAASYSGSESIKSAFSRNKPWQDVVERVTHGRYRIRSG